MNESNKSRRSFFRNICLSGLVFSGVKGLSGDVNAASGDSKKMKHWDVIVVGGGPGGVPAAVSAARGGASVLLVESYGFLGGMATAGLVLPFM